MEIIHSLLSRYTSFLVSVLSMRIARKRKAVLILEYRNKEIYTLEAMSLDEIKDILHKLYSMPADGR